MKELKPKVSIIVNCFNYERYVEVAIRSALNQTYEGVEVVVVDDGSTDSSRNVIDAIEGEFTKIYKENGGQASALNAGFKASNGKIVCFLDADDFLYPEAAARVLENWNEETTRAFSCLDIVNKNGEQVGKRIPRSSRLLPSGKLREIQIKRGVPCPPTSGNWFARNLLSQILPIPEKYRISADGYLFAKAPFYGQTSKILKPLGAYRVHGNNFYSGKKDFESTLKTTELVGDALREISKQNDIKLPRYLLWRNYGVFEADIEKNGFFKALKRLWIYCIDSRRYHILLLSFLRLFKAKLSQ